MTVIERSSTVTLCASVVNPNVSLNDTVQILVMTVNSTAQGCKNYKNIIIQYLNNL